MLNLRQSLTIRIPAPAGTKTVTIEFPTDDHLDRRQKARSFSIKGEVETVHECPALDVEIVNELKKSGDDLEQSECTYLLNKLMSVDITDGGRTDEGFFVEMQYLGFTMRHVLGTPSADQLQKYRREFLKSASTRYGGTTYTTHLRPGRELYDKLLVRNEGYPEGYVPIMHKAMAVSELSNLIEAEVKVENPTQPPTATAASQP
jgi:hypothetical protein